MMPVRIGRYLKTCTEADDRPLHSGSLAGVERVVVIPALAERESLFNTIVSLSGNPPEELRDTLVLCVVNNRPPRIADPAHVADNRETLRMLKGIIDGRVHAGTSPASGTAQTIARVQASGLRLACLDASSEGREMPEKNGGVGLARKMGMDRALSILDYSPGKARLLYCLDADTLAEDNYLSAVQDHFDGGRSVAAVVSYAHQEASDPRLQAAACSYEIYLRYYVMGLAYASSPYAFHTIGSTMACRAEAYASVRGMVRRDAAEDFYFLNKLAKVGPVGRVTSTRVHPSSRASARVPFGTGRRMISYREGSREEYMLYDPDVFSVLKGWLHEMTAFPDRDAGQVGKAARSISPLLAGYLEESSFHESWERIKANSGSPDILRRQFHVLFDAFRTMKLIHYLTDNGMPRVPMFAALERLLRLTKKSTPLPPGIPDIPPIEALRSLLSCLRSDAAC